MEERDLEQLQTRFAISNLKDFYMIKQSIGADSMLSGRMRELLMHLNEYEPPYILGELI